MCHAQTPLQAGSGDYSRARPSRREMDRYSAMRNHRSTAKKWTSARRRGLEAHPSTRQAHHYRQIMATCCWHHRFNRPWAGRRLLLTRPDDRMDPVAHRRGPKPSPHITVMLLLARATRGSDAVKPHREPVLYATFANRREQRAPAKWGGAAKRFGSRQDVRF